MLAQLKLACLSGLSMAQLSLALGATLGVLLGRVLPTATRRGG